MTIDRETKRKIVMILFAMVFLIIAFIEGKELYNNIKNKQTTYYKQIASEYMTKDINNETISQKLIPKSNDMIEYIVQASYNTGLEGQVYLKVKLENELLISKQYDVQTIKYSEGFKFDLEELDLLKGNEYEIEILFKTDSSIFIEFDNNNEARVIQVFKFNYSKQLAYIVILGFLLLLIGYIYIVFGKQYSIHKVFIVVGLIAGIGITFLLPPMSTPDEARHFRRAYDIAQGNWIAKNINEEGQPIAYLPTSINDITSIGIQKEDGWWIEANGPILLENMIAAFDHELSPEKEAFRIHGTNTISPIAYLPQIIGIKIGILLDQSPLMIYYIARIMNVLYWIACCYISLRLIPVFKNIILAICFLPGMFIIASSCSTDGILVGTIITYISYILYIKYNKISIKQTRHILITSIFAIILASIKLPYVLIIGFGVIIPNRDKRKKEQWWIIASAIVIGIGSYILWSKIGSTVGGNGVGSSSHIRYILENPVAFGELLITTFINGIKSYVEGWFNNIAYGYSSKDFVIISYICVLIMVSMRSSASIVVDKFLDKSILVLISTILIIGILVAAFMWQPIDIGYIWGIQGRYFIPILPLVCMSLSQTNGVNTEKEDSRYVYIYIMYIILCSLFNCIKLYFI